MSLYNDFMKILAYKPLRLWILDTTSPFTDISGYSGTATLTGTMNKGVALSSGAAYSQILDSTHTIAFDSPVYQAGYESQPFSLMATIFPVQKTSTGDQQILSNSGKYDGLVINGTTVSFSTKYVTNGSAKCSFDLDGYRRADVVGVHSKTKNSLYVNGELVDEVDITQVQQNDTYDAPNSNLYAGNTTSTQGLMLNAVGIFPSALTSEGVKDIYTSLNRRFVGSVARGFGGQELAISKIVKTPYIDIDADTAFWRSGVMRNCSVDNGLLVTDIYAGVTVRGTWEKSFEITDKGVNTLLNSVNLQWIGKNVTVETSVDNGNTWVTATSAVNLSNVPSGFDPTNKQLMVRITFTEAQSEGYIKKFELNAYNTNTYTPAVGRTITYTSAVPMDEYPVMDLRDNQGVKLVAGTLAFSADTSQETYDARTIEVWMRRNSSSAPTYSFTPTTTYIDGDTTNTTSQGEWALYHFVLPSVVTTFSISGDVTIGKVSIYNTALSAGTIASIENNYTGVEKQTLTTGGTLQLAEAATPISIYAHDWSISAA